MQSYIHGCKLTHGKLNLQDTHAHSIDLTVVEVAIKSHCIFKK